MRAPVASEGTPPANQPAKPTQQQTLNQPTTPQTNQPTNPTTHPIAMRPYTLGIRLNNNINNHPTGSSTNYQFTQQPLWQPASQPTI
jgi:hypothetical protein